MTNEGFIRLVEAMMEQAYKDLKDKNPSVRADAEKYIEEMKSMF